MATAREVALQTLIDTLVGGAYSNHALTDQFSKNELTPQDKNFATEIVYGTLQNHLLLEYYMEPYLNGKAKKWVRLLTEMTLYQIIFLDSVPEHAAVSEAVAIAKKRGGEFNGKLVNAICREVLRHPLRTFEQISDEGEQLGIQTSHPTWLIKLWMKQYGKEKTMQMLKANNERVQLSIRVNTAKCTKEQLTQALTNEGITVKDGYLSEDALIIEKGNVVSTQAFKDGLFYFQDESSMLVAHALNPQANDKVLDTCAAPGGKTTHIAAMLNGSGEVCAHDIYEHKITLIKENLDRLGLTNVKASIADASTLNEKYEAETFDRILIDAPCTGLGVMRRHPEAKLTKKPEDLDAIHAIQQKILNNVAPLVKHGGTIVYSTCTVNRKENDKMVEQFLKQHKEFELDTTLADRLPQSLKHQATTGMVQLIPGDFNTDGFFFAALKRN